MHEVIIALCDSACRKAEENSLDLNDYPEEHGEQPIEESSMTSAASVGNTRE